MSRRRKLPRHIQTAIETRTGLPLGLSERIKPGHCPDCGRAILAGYDAPAITQLAILDPNALTPQLEAAAILTRRPTWQLHGTPGHYQISTRTAPGIPNTWKLTPADKCVVLTNHQCEKPPLTDNPVPLHSPSHQFEDDPQFYYEYLETKRQYNNRKDK